MAVRKPTERELRRYLRNAWWSENRGLLGLVIAISVSTTAWIGIGWLLYVYGPAWAQLLFGIAATIGLIGAKMIAKRRRTHGTGQSQQ